MVLYLASFPGEGEVHLPRVPRGPLDSLDCAIRSLVKAGFQSTLLLLFIHGLHLP